MVSSPRYDRAIRHAGTAVVEPMGRGAGFPACRGDRGGRARSRRRRSRKLRPQDADHRARWLSMSQNPAVNRIWRIAKVPANQGLFEFYTRVPRARVYVCFIAILKLPFKFARHHRLQQQAGKRRWTRRLGDELNGAGSQKGILQITVGREPRSGDEAA